MAHEITFEYGKRPDQGWLYIDNRRIAVTQLGVRWDLKQAFPVVDLSVCASSLRFINLKELTPCEPDAPTPMHTPVDPDDDTHGCVCGKYDGTELTQKFGGEEDLGGALVAILSEHCGEAGESEGAVETLERIIKERDTARDELDRKTWTE